MSEDSKTYRSYGASVLDDNLSIGINIKYLVRILVFFCLVGWWAMHFLERLETVEERLLEANEQIKEILDKQLAEQKKAQVELEEKVLFYEKEFNINPLSWGKKKRKK